MIHGETPAPLVTLRTDDDLMALAKGGSLAAFDTLVRRHQRVVLKVALHHLRDAHLARDVAQQTFVELHKYLPRYEARGRFAGYLHRILLNQCRMAARRRRSEEPLEVAQEEEAPMPKPDEAILRRERRRAVREALSLLSPTVREAVVLRFMGELSHDEIATALDVPIGTVKSRLAAGFEKLRQNLRGNAT